MAWNKNFRKNIDCKYIELTQALMLNTLMKVEKIKLGTAVHPAVKKSMDDLADRFPDVSGVKTSLILAAWLLFLETPESVQKGAIKRVHGAEVDGVMDELFGVSRSELSVAAKPLGDTVGVVRPLKKKK